MFHCGCEPLRNCLKFIETAPCIPCYSDVAVRILKREILPAGESAVRPIRSSPGLLSGTILRTSINLCVTHAGSTAHLMTGNFVQSGVES